MSLCSVDLHSVNSVLVHKSVTLLIQTLRSSQPGAPVSNLCNSRPCFAKLVSPVCNLHSTSAGCLEILLLDQVTWYKLLDQQRSRVLCLWEGFEVPRHSTGTWGFAPKQSTVDHTRQLTVSNTFLLEACRICHCKPGSQVTAIPAIASHS
jgi:hypothetical protein